jgi:hypothetical protein
MDDKLFIPNKIKVGFQDRSDTYTKKLAYIIYFDAKGVLRKEKSWQSWRDKKIEPEEFDNKPQSGFIINKNIERYKWSHFSTGRTMIRIYDPRGFEFEITPENLIGILMHCDCLKRGLDGEYVYAWCGTELALLPVSSQEYQSSKDYTELQSQKISAKNLVQGISYKTKQQKNVIYLGRFEWFTWPNSYYIEDGGKRVRKGRKMHIFYKEGSKTTSDSSSSYEVRSSVDFLATKNSDNIVSNFAALIGELQKNSHVKKVIGYEFTPAEFDLTIQPADKKRYEYSPSLKRKSYFYKHGELAGSISVTQKFERDYVGGNYSVEYKPVDKFSYYKGGILLDLKTGEVTAHKDNDRNHFNINYHNEAFIRGFSLGNVYAVFEDGSKKKLDSSFIEV